MQIQIKRESSCHFFQQFRIRFIQDLDDSIDDNDTRFDIQTNIRPFLFTL